MTLYAVPGLYVDVAVRPPARGFPSGIPAFLGFLPTGEANEPVEVSRWSGFAERFLVAGEPAAPGALPRGAALVTARHLETESYLPHAVRGFFLNGGRRCLVVPLACPGHDAPAESWVEAVREGLRALEGREEPDLVCLPDAALARKGEVDARPTALRMQQAVRDHCDRLGNRFALLDSLPLGSDATTAEWAAALAAQSTELRSPNAALYHPWLRTERDPELPRADTVPPCGHLAGIYARTDRETGVHKAPGNVEVAGALDLVPEVNETVHQEIVPEVNCLRAFPRRGIVVWGARTLAGPDDAEWRYVPVRRLFLGLARWLDRTLHSMAFEPNTLALWNRITRETTAYLNELYRAGALQGASAQEAFSVRCDEITNPPESVELGRVVTEIRVAARAPNEFVVVRITHGGGGTTLTGPLPG